MAKKPARRTRSPHPGVKLLTRSLPSGTVQHRARWTDPDTGREKETSLDKLLLTTREARRKWAIDKSKSLALIRADREAGIERSESLPIERAVNEYLARVAVRRRPTTVAGYRFSSSLFAAWAARDGVGETGDLTPARLRRFRDHLSALPKRVASKGEKRGSRTTTSTPCSPVSVNRYLKECRAMLSAWADGGLTPRVHHDDLRRALKLLPVERAVPDFLAPREVAALLDAAIRHDAATYVETRREHRGERPKGSTKRYRPIAPFVAFLLLSGCRRGEALGLRWSMVKLEADGGWQEGVIVIPPELVKTRRGRQVDLAVSPGLRELLSATGVGEPGATVFGYTANDVDTARNRMTRDFGAPKRLTWQLLRRTASTVLCNAAGIFPSGVAAFKSAKQLGHSIAVMESRYAGLVNIDPAAKSVEQAMVIEPQLRAIIRTTEAGRPTAGEVASLDAARARRRA